MKQLHLTKKRSCKYFNDYDIEIKKGSNQFEINITKADSNGSEESEKITFEKQESLKLYNEKFNTSILKEAESLSGKLNPDGYKDYLIPPERLAKVNIKKDLIFDFFSFENDSKSLFYSGFRNSKGEKHGYGIVLSSNGEKYEGYFENNLFQPFGRYINSKGDIYEGAFVNSKLNGLGKLIKKRENLYRRISVWGEKW